MQGEVDLLGDEEGCAEEEEEFAIVFAAMGVNMETAHFFKQVGCLHVCLRTRDVNGRVSVGEMSMGMPVETGITPPAPLFRASKVNEHVGLALTSSRDHRQCALHWPAGF